MVYSTLYFKAIYKTDVADKAVKVTSFNWLVFLVNEYQVQVNKEKDLKRNWHHKVACQTALNSGGSAAPGWEPQYLHLRASKRPTYCRCKI